MASHESSEKLRIRIGTCWKLDNESFGPATDLLAKQAGKQREGEISPPVGKLLHMQCTEYWFMNIEGQGVSEDGTKQ